MLIDDPLKDRQEANSSTMRDRTWDWYAAVARTRLEENAAVVVVQTRWHDDDLTGRLLRQARDDPQADQWEVLHFPALDAEGAALWPEKYPAEELQTIRATIGSWEFAALYQGDPKPEEGAIFKQEWFRRYDMPPHKAECYVIQVWDTAFEKGAENDPSACITLGVKDNQWYLLNVYRRRMEYPELVDQAKAQAGAWQPNVLEVEDAGSGRSLVQSLIRLTGLPVVRVKPDRAKTERAMLATPYCEAGRVWLPKAAPWLADFEQELFRFPGAEHDDQVDAFVYALLRAGAGTGRRWRLND